LFFDLIECCIKNGLDDRFIAQVQLKVEDMVSMSAMKPGQGQVGQNKVAPKEENVLMKQDFN